MIATPDMVRESGNFPKTLRDEQILPHLRAASRRLKRWVGSTVYDAAVVDKDTYDEDQTQALQDAEAYLCISIGIRSWNMVMETAGEVGAAGISSMSGVANDVQTSYLSQGALETAEKSYLMKAEESARDWLLDSAGGGLPGPGISYAYDDDGVPIDKDYGKET